MRLVIDTNVMLVSVSSKSPYHWIFRLFADKQHELCVTIDILLEYQEKFIEHLGAEKAAGILAAIVEWPHLIRVNTFFNFNLIHKDPDDNKFVDCAIASSAFAIVTQDNDFNVLKSIRFPKVGVLSIDELKELIKSNQGEV